jgi:hypothetical protein
MIKVQLTLPVKKVCVTSFSKFFIIKVFIEMLCLDFVRNTSKRKINRHDKERITPDGLLKRYMWEKLQLEKKNHQATTGGKDLSEEDLKRYEAIRTDKKRILENVIFPAMANLIFFFESIDQEPILLKVFKENDDVEDLLGIRRIGPSPENYGIFFIRLFRSMLGLNYYDKEDYRLRLMREAMKIIYLKMMQISPLVYQNLTGSRLTIKYIGDGMGRAFSHTDDVSRDVKDPYDFRILGESDDKAKQREKFIKHARIEAPNKTLVIDTKGILKRGY